MLEISKNQHPKQAQKYYPACIKEAETQKNIKTLLSIMNKILNLPVRRNRIPAELLITISCFVFNNPIVLAYPLYQLIQENVVCHSTYLLYSRKKQTTHRLEIKKYWKKLERTDISMDGVMRLAVHFDDCLDLKSNPIQQQGQTSDQKWKIISQSNHYYQSLFKIMTRYKKDRIINQYVIKAFSEIMNHNILLAVVDYAQYLIIDSNEHGHRKKIIRIKIDQGMKIGFSFQHNLIKLVSHDLDVYTPTARIIKSGRQILFDSSTCSQISLDSVYIR